MKCFVAKKILVEDYDKRIEMLGEDLKLTEELAAFFAELEGGLTNYHKLEEVLFFLSSQNTDLASEIEAKGEFTLGHVKKNLNLKYDTPSILNFSRMGDNTAQGPEAYGAYVEYIYVGATAETRDTPVRKLDHKRPFIYDKGRWKMFMAWPGT